MLGAIRASIFWYGILSDLTYHVHFLYSVVKAYTLPTYIVFYEL